jgi:hypothetical protein
MGRIRHLLPHVVELRFESARSLPNRQDGESAEVAAADPLSLAEGFVEHVTATPPEPDEVALLRDAVERVRIAQVSA